MTLMTHQAGGLRLQTAVRSDLTNAVRKRLNGLAAAGAARWTRARNLAGTRRCLLRLDDAFLSDIGMSRERLGSQPGPPIPPQEYLWGQR